MDQDEVKRKFASFSKLTGRSIHMKKVEPCDVCSAMPKPLGVRMFMSKEQLASGSIVHRGDEPVMPRHERRQCMI